MGDRVRVSKQLIVMRKDLKMRKGKMVAQGAHASLKAILDQCVVTTEGTKKQLSIFLDKESAVDVWLTDRFTKICVSVDSEAELLAIYSKAIDAGLATALIKDAGLTEFNGVPTLTCCAIGPHWSDEIDPITGHLQPL